MRYITGGAAGSAVLAGLLVVLSGIPLLQEPLAAQDSAQAVSSGAGGQVYIDLDGDGINDVFQRGLGFRKNRAGSRGILLIPGTEEVSKGKALQGHRFQTGTGEAYLLMTPQAMEEQLHGQWGILDETGDGTPDTGAASIIQLHLEAQREWKKTVRERIRNGLPPFIDVDQDGVPDDKPPGYNWRKRQGQRSVP